MRCQLTRLLAPSALVVVFASAFAGCAAPRTAVQDGDSSAQEARGFRARDGFFLAGLGAMATLEDSDFDGQSAGTFSPGTETTVLPELDSGSGWGIAIGWRGVANSFQYTYTTTEHESTSFATSGDDLLKTYSLDFKHHFNIDGRMQPFVLVGVTVPRLIVEGGTFDAGLTQIGNAKYQGLGANLGLGGALYLTDRIALVGEGFYRWAYFDEATGVNDDGHITGGINASGFSARLGLSFTF